jgi:hypothetical protein
MNQIVAITEQSGANDGFLGNSTIRRRGMERAHTIERRAANRTPRSPESALFAHWHVFPGKSLQVAESGHPASIETPVTSIERLSIMGGITDYIASTARVPTIIRAATRRVGRARAPDTTCSTKKPQFCRMPTSAVA